MLFATLISPVTLCFALGAFAAWIRSDLRLPEQVAQGLSLYLMLAIGLKGGVAVSQVPMADLLPPAGAALLLSLAIPLGCYAVLRGLLRLGTADAAALAAHYGSVSAVTFLAALTYLERQAIPVGGEATALLAIMEFPAILIALLLARRGEAAGRPVGAILRRTLSGKSIVLLVGGLLMGTVIGPAGFAPVSPVFVELFPGLLCLFLLDLGMQTVQQAREQGRIGVKLAAFAVLVPPVNAALALALAALGGFSAGTAAILAVLAASASYIAAPAAMRLALPQANPAYYLTCALTITFPLNLLIGVPVYVAMALWVTG